MIAFFQKSSKKKEENIHHSYSTMAEIDEINEKNVSGKYYVDTNCIDCDLCRAAAPDFFVRDDEEGLSYVTRQPESPEEVELCEEVLEGCPVGCIGNDGD